MVYIDIQSFAAVVLSGFRVETGCHWNCTEADCQEDTMMMVHISMSSPLICKCHLNTTLQISLGKILWLICRWIFTTFHSEDFLSSHFYRELIPPKDIFLTTKNQSLLHNWKKNWTDFKYWPRPTTSQRQTIKQTETRHQSRLNFPASKKWSWLHKWQDFVKILLRTWYNQWSGEHYETNWNTIW